MMRRILLMLSVALVMVAMVAVTAAPAFADPGQGNTTDANRGFSQNLHGDHRNDSTGCCDRGNSFAYGDGLN